MTNDPRYSDLSYGSDEDYDDYMEYLDSMENSKDSDPPNDEKKGNVWEIFKGIDRGKVKINYDKESMISDLISSLNGHQVEEYNYIMNYLKKEDYRHFRKLVNAKNNPEDDDKPLYKDYSDYIYGDKDDIPWAKDDEGYFPAATFFDQWEFDESKGYEESFDNNACGATSLLNAVSLEYSKLTGMELTEAQAHAAMKAAIEAGHIDEKAAYVADWAGAANEMWESMEEYASVELKGDWSYKNNSGKGDYTIWSQDRGNEGTHDHFLLQVDRGNAFDPGDGEVKYKEDIHLTKGRETRDLYIDS